MKKTVSIFLLATLGMSLSTYAQLTEGRTPKTLAVNTFEVPTRTIKVAPLNAEEIAEDLKDPSNANAIARLSATDISFPESGTIVLAPDGTRVWRVQVNMPHSLGLGFYFDKYQLPQGVEMFIYNENKRHVKGAYTNLENQDDKMFATGPVQGGVAYIELNIEPSVDINAIELHINEVASYFRGALPEFRYYSDEESLKDVSVIGAYDNVFFEGSSVCMINAKCPEGDGFENQRKATVHTLIVAGGYIYTCSGTMVNKLDNSPSSCTPLLLTASHCEPDNLKSGARFTSQYILRFNNESATCSNPVLPPNANEITGVDFVSRSTYNKSRPATEIKADFLLVKPRKPIAMAWDVVLNGWKSNLPTITVSAPNKIIGFHHPGGDIKKVSYASRVTNYSLGAAGTHWNMQTEVGYAAKGSSGSGLFDKDGRLIGIASVSTGVGPSACKEAEDGRSDALSTSYDLSYSKLSYCWTNPGETAPADNNKVKPWLDPLNTGVQTTDAVKSDCTPLSTTSTDKVNPFTATMNIYPNPSNTGVFELQLNNLQSGVYKIEVLDITGRVISSVSYDNLSSQLMKLDLSNAPNGIYLVKFSNEYGSSVNKITITK